MLAGDLTTEPATPAYLSRAVPLVTPEAAQVVEPVGGSRPTELGEGRLNIEIIPGQELRSNPAAMAAVERAAQQWESHLFDPITVSIEIEIGDTDDGVLGFAIPRQVVLPYSEVRAALQTDGLQEADDSITARLPAADAIEFALPEGTEYRGDISIAKANAKAIGLRPGDLDDRFGVADGGIVMSGQIDFDFNRDDGIEPGQFDFESVVVHEIGHVLGFFSSTDRFATNFVPDVIAPTPLDLFRFRSLEGANNPRTPAAFESIQRELRPSTPSVIDFVLQDGWNLPAVEYPVELGEPANIVPLSPFGYQASHWQDSDLFGETIGVLVPTIPPQTVVSISNVDLRAMDLIGYDVLPPDQTPQVPTLTEDATDVLGNQTQIVIDVLANDRNDSVPFQLSTFQIVEPPSVGQVQFDPVTGLIVFEIPPGRGDHLHAFTYTIANDQGIFGDPALVEVSITGAGRTPLVIDDFVLTRQNQSVTFNPLSNDADDGELSLQNLRIISGPSSGNVSIGTGSLVYEPNTDFTGRDSFVYAIADDDGLEATGLVDITVGESLIPPVIPGQPLTMMQRADVNGDRSLSPVDALMIINRLRRQERVPDVGERSPDVEQMDVSGDGKVSPLPGSRISLRNFSLDGLIQRLSTRALSTD